MVVGSVVATKKKGLSVKNSDFAIVVSLNPFVLVSSCYTMVWDGQLQANFEEIHQAHPDITRKAIKTWKNGIDPVETIDQCIHYLKRNSEAFVGASVIVVGEFYIGQVANVQIFRENPLEPSNPFRYNCPMGSDKNVMFDALVQLLETITESHVKIYKNKSPFYNGDILVAEIFEPITKLKLLGPVLKGVKK
jgi:hypothetical protein